jgi:uncharacterized coiled-coil DUF342 family protein
MNDKKPSELIEVTVALDEELSRVEHLAESAARVPLNSRRNLEKAARITSEAAEAQNKVGVHIAKMMAALNGVRQRNEANVQALQGRSDEIQRRSDELTALLSRFDEIGKEAQQITQLAQQVTGAGPSVEVGNKLRELESRMANIAESARSLWEQAAAGDWGDMARDADSLRQQVLAAKNKLGLISKRLTQPN